MLEGTGMLKRGLSFNKQFLVEGINRSKQQSRTQESKISVDFRFGFIQHEGATKLKRFL